MSENCEWVWTGDKNGNFKQFSVKDKKMVYDFGKLIIGGIWSSFGTADSEFLFMGNNLSMTCHG